MFLTIYRIGSLEVILPENLIANHNFLLFFAISSLALAEASKESYPDEEASLSGSILSLAHSNSSTSFPAGSL